MTDANKNNNQAKPQLTQEQIKQLMAMMQTQKPLSKWQSFLIKALNKYSEWTKIIIHHMERFINYILKDQDIHRNDVVQTARGPILFGTYVIIIFIVIGGLWSVLAPLDSAAVAIGTVIPSSKRKIIQHPTGGTIKQIYVQLGDKVKTGDKILELDEVNYKAKYESALSQYRTMLAAESRLIAERDDLSDIIFDEFLTNDVSIAAVATLMATQRELFFSKEEAYKKRLESLEQKHLQISKQLESAKAKAKSALKTKQVNDERLKSVQELYSKGFIKRSDLLESEARAAEAESQLASATADIARMEQGLAQDTAEMIQFKNSYIADILKELNEIQRQKNQAKEEYLAAKDGYDKIVLRSPVDGTIIEMHYNTIGGVIQGGAPITEIVPSNDKLIIEARIPNREIDAVNIGLKAKIRFSAFKSRTTPVFNGTVVSLSPDIVQDRNQQPSPEGPVYIAKIEIDMEEFDKVSKGKLILRPGMQAEVQIVRGTRTLLQYLLDPVTDNMFKAFKEK